MRCGCCAALLIPVVGYCGVSWGDARVELMPSIPPPYFGGEYLAVDVSLVQDHGGVDRYLRLVQFDFANSSAQIVPAPQFAFDLSLVPLPTYAIFPNTPRPAVVSTSLSLPPGGLYVLPAVEPLFIGSLGVTLPDVEGCYLLDAMNVGNPSQALVAQVAFGFGGPGDPVTYWRASTGALFGGMMAVPVGSYCHNDNNACTCDQCVVGGCQHTPVEFGNVNCSTNQPPNLDDILCCLAAFGDFDVCPNADLAPSCQGNNIINLDDILAILVAFSGVDPCGCTP
jgi:hypothetical protein